MTLFKEWEERAYKIETKEEYDAFWNEYLEQEKKIYKDVLGKKQSKISGKVKDLALDQAIEPVVYCGFIDGINTSLAKEVEVDGLEEDTVVDMEIDFEKLYFNMLDAKAPWLYELEEWNEILSSEKREEITKEYRESKVVRVEKIGRNEPCPCGSGRKYKKCCGK